jgi:hypothetical protein
MMTPQVSYLEPLIGIWNLFDQLPTFFSALSNLIWLPFPAFQDSIPLHFQAMPTLSIWHPLFCGNLSLGWRPKKNGLEVFCYEVDDFPFDISAWSSVFSTTVLNIKSLSSSGSHSLIGTYVLTIFVCFLVWSHPHIRYAALNFFRRLGNGFRTAISSCCILRWIQRCRCWTIRLLVSIPSSKGTQ